MMQEARKIENVRNITVKKKREKKRQKKKFSKKIKEKNAGKVANVLTEQRKVIEEKKPEPFFLYNI